MAAISRPFVVVSEVYGVVLYCEYAFPMALTCCFKLSILADTVYFLFVDVVAEVDSADCVSPWLGIGGLVQPDCFNFYVEEAVGGF